MKKLKINFVDTWDACVQYFVDILSTRFEVEISNDAEFLLFCDETFGNSNINYSKKDITKIFYTGENRRPENYDCHYAISFDHNFNPWHYRLPLYVMDMWAIQNYHNISDKPYDYLFSIPKVEIKDKTDFCAFVHRNGGNPLRNNFFKKLTNQYKKVNSAGFLLNNTNINLPDVSSKIQYFSKHKFSLCFENSSHPGYVTEKILHGFYGNTIPIYWGSRTIMKDFNPNSFINYFDFSSEDKLIEKIKEIDNNDDLYLSIVNSPKFLYNIPNDNVISFNFLNWFESIVYQKIYSK
jgi:hypothetical protein